MIDSTKIGIASSVSKSFYNLLLTLEQITVLKEDTARLEKNLKDTYHQYKGGLSDQTDYKEATITLNNALSQLNQARESILPQYAILKEMMGFPSDKNFNVSFDTMQMAHSINWDTAQVFNYEKRIEFQQLETTKRIQQKTINYYKYSALPSLTGIYSYNYEYENNLVSNLFQQAYPYSYIGASISFPLFTGFNRYANLQKAKLQGQIIDLQELQLKATTYTEYATALNNYKSNLYNYQLMKENVAMARDVYKVVSLQYKQGIVAYLNVITAESNLISSEISYLNALFQVLLSKVDLERAMGNTLTKY